MQKPAVLRLVVATVNRFLPGKIPKQTYVFLVLTLSLLLATVSEAYFLVIDAHGEECFFDRVTTATKMGLTFEVVEGGFLDIDVTITGMFFSSLLCQVY